MSILFVGETPLVNPCPPVHLFTLFTTSFTCFHIHLLAGPFPYFHSLHYTFNRFVFSRPGRLTTFLPLGQSNCLSVCGQALEIVDGYLVVDFKVLLVRLNLGFSLRENCYLLHPCLRLGHHPTLLSTLIKPFLAPLPGSALKAT